MYLHAQQPAVLHRDLKSLNVLLTESGQAKLCDFGLAAAVKTHVASCGSARGASSAAAVGSVFWMAPELFERKGRGGQDTDVFALGCVLYELAARTYPWACESCLLSPVCSVSCRVVG